MREVITIKLIADDAENIGVYSSFLPAIGKSITPVKALALELINIATHSTGKHALRLVDVTDSTPPADGSQPHE